MSERRAPYVPIDARGWRLTMGLRPLEDAAWLEVDEHRDEELALKQSLLERSRSAVVATRPAGDAPSKELLDEVRRWLATYHRDEVADDDEHPIVAASRLVQEDLCVLVRSDTWRLEAACVCFPSRWDLSTKIGRTLDEIHAPVPSYDEELSGPTASVFDRMRPERSFWRLNWSLLDSPDLFQPTSERSAPGGDFDQWYFRVERQTLRRLPVSGAIVFTIRTYVTTAATMCERDVGFAELLVHALDTTPAPMQDYKGWRGVAQCLRASLDAASN
jgi:hypothetical protein